MSLSPLAIVVFLVAAIVIKISALIAIGVAALRRFDRWPVYGVWYLVGDEQRVVDMTSAKRPPVPLVRELEELLSRNFARLEMTRSGDTITLRSADGRSFNYGGGLSKLTRTVSGGVEVGASWERLGDTMRLESNARGAGRVVETYRPAGRNLHAEVRITAPGSGVDQVALRCFGRSGAEGVR